VGLYTDPPAEATILCVDELGPVTPRNFPPAPGWSPDGHRIKVPLDDERGPDKTWVYGALCVRDGQALTQTAPSRNTAGDLALLQALDQAHPPGTLYLVADNLASHSRGPIRDWLAAHPRIQHAFIPVGAAWLNLIEGWLRASSAAKPLPVCRWPMPLISPTPRASPRTNSIAMRAHGSGPAPLHHTAGSGAVSSIAFEERRIIRPTRD
jgi:DDE superfamily endonuclease